MPFFNRPPAECNLSLQIRDAATRLDDASLASLGEQIDWHEPVITQERSLYAPANGRRPAYQKLSTPIEVLLLCAQPRWVSVLLPVALAQPAPLVEYPLARAPSSDDAPTLDRWINAAICSGSVPVLRQLLDMAWAKEEGHAGFGWVGQSQNRPLTCLAMQANQPPETVWAMWELLRDKLLASSHFPKHARKEYGQRMLARLRDDSVAMGSHGLAQLIAQKCNRALELGEWKEMVEQGQVAWGMDFARTQPLSADASGLFPDLPPLAYLIQKAITQLDQLSASPNATTSPDWAKFCVQAQAQFDRFLVAVGEGVDGDRLLSSPRDRLGDCLAPLIAREPSRAAQFLNAHQAPMGEGEAIEWLSAGLQDFALDGLMASRLARTSPPDNAEAASLRLFAWVEANTPVHWPRVAEVSAKLALPPDHIRSWPMPSESLAHAFGEMLTAEVPAVSIKPARRL